MTYIGLEHSDYFNHWNAAKEEMGFSKVDDSKIFPIMLYMSDLRNRFQHDLYPNRITKRERIEPGKILTDYPFPVFESGQPIRISEDDIKALVFEARAQLAANLVPYINVFLQNRAAAAKKKLQFSGAKNHTLALYFKKNTIC
jgi:hypothetical protein